MIWEEVNGDYVTPGGDPLWICPKCKSKKSRHCYGVENINSPVHECPNCGEKLLYPREIVEIPKNVPSRAAFFKDKNPSEELISKVIPKHTRDKDTNQKNKKLLYGLYQLNWMSEKGYTIDDLISSMIGFSFDDGKYKTNTHMGICYCLDDMLADWEKESGFGGTIWKKGSIWKSFEEFLGAEFLISEYIEKLINKLTETEKREELQKWYQKYMQNKN